MLSDAKPLPTLQQIGKAGELQQVAFAQQVLTFTPIRELDPIEARCPYRSQGRNRPSQQV